MAGKKQDLMGDAQLAYGLDGRAGAPRIEVHKDVIKNHGQRFDVVRIFTDERKPHRQIQLLGSAAAQHLRRQTSAVNAFDLDLRTVDGSEDAPVTSICHYRE